MDKYMKEIANIPLMTLEEEQETAQRAKNGDLDARNELVSRNLRFVIDVAKGYQGQGLSFEELIAEGNVGLCKAADRFDPDRGIKFITYAVWWIRQGILQALSENSRLIRLPLNRINEVQRAKKIAEEHAAINGPDGLYDISELTDVDPASLDIYNLTTVRINSENKSEQNIVELIESTEVNPPDHDLEQESLKIDINYVLDQLTDREKEIIRYYHGIDEFKPFTLEEIGNIIGLTRERIRQIKKKALQQIRRNPRVKKLIKYK